MCINHVGERQQFCNALVFDARFYSQNAKGLKDKIKRKRFSIISKIKLMLYLSRGATVLKRRLVNGTLNGKVKFSTHMEHQLLVVV